MAAYREPLPCPTVLSPAACKQPPAPPARPPAGLQLPGLMNSLDFLNLMTYDYHGGWERQVNHLHPWNDPLVSAGCGAGGGEREAGPAAGATADAPGLQLAPRLCPSALNSLHCPQLLLWPTCAGGHTGYRVDSELLS